MIHDLDDRKPLSIEWIRPRATPSAAPRTILNAIAGPIYERIKARLLEQSPGGGELQIGALAMELGTSNTPVREALVRLAAERLIEYVPKRGFLAKTISQAELRGLYTVNQALLQAASNTRCESVEGNEEAKWTRALQGGAGQGGNATALAHATGDLFLRIALQCGMEEIAAIVRNTNDRLYHARIAESAVIGDARATLLSMNILYSTGSCEKLNQAIRHYHDLRLRMLVPIHKELVLRPLIEAMNSRLG